MLRLAVDTVRAGRPHPDVVRGALRALDADRELTLTLVGPEALVRDELAGSRPDLPTDRVHVVDAPRSVGPDDDAVVAVRARHDASVRVAVDLVARGAADAVVSAGPAAAAVAAARFGLRRRSGVRTPALAAAVAIGGRTLLVVDAGASADAPLATLVRYGELGAELARARGVPAPRVAALAPLGAHVTSRAVTELVAGFGAADLHGGRFVGALDTQAALAGDVDVLATAGAAGRILVDAVGLAGGGGPGHALLVGVDATVATLGAAATEVVADALLDIATLVRHRATASVA